MPWPEESSMPAVGMALMIAIFVVGAVIFIMMARAHVQIEREKVLSRPTPIPTVVVVP